MSWTRCTSCGTHLDSARFPHCPICGYFLPPADPVAAGTAANPALPGPPGEEPEVEAEAARDGAISNYALGGGILLGLVGPGLIALSARGSETLLGVFLIILVVLAIYGAKSRAKDDLVGFTVGKVAKTALSTIGLVVAASAVLFAAGFALLFVVCVVATGTGS